MYLYNLLKEIDLCSCGGQASPRSVGHTVRTRKLETLRKELIVLSTGKMSSSARKSVLTDCIGPAQIIQDNLLYIKSTDCS